MRSVHKVGEHGYFRGFKVTYIGKVSVEEAGGRELIWESEGFEHTESGKPKFKQTEQFLEGRVKLHLYTFEQGAECGFN